MAPWPQLRGCFTSRVGSGALTAETKPAGQLKENTNMKNATKFLLGLFLCVLPVLDYEPGIAQAKDPPGQEAPNACSPRQVVLDFLAQSDSRDTNAYLRFFADSPTTCYSNTGITNPRGETGGCYLGLTEIGNVLDTLLPLVDENVLTVLDETHQGSIVMVRRSDTFTISAFAGQIFSTAHVGAHFSIPVMGFFTVDHCRITRWSDHFNLADFTTPSGIPLQ